MSHVEKFGLLTEDQYGGRKHCQAQSAVINKVLYYNIQNQLHEDAIFIDKDGRSCFDRLIPNIVSLENEKCGASKQANQYMQDTLNQSKDFILKHVDYTRVYNTCTLEKRIC